MTSFAEKVVLLPPLITTIAAGKSVGQLLKITLKAEAVLPTLANG